MFDWALFLCLVVVSVPGLLIAIPNLMQRLEKTAASRLPPGRALPPRPVLIAATLGQSLILVAVLQPWGRPSPPGSDWRRHSSRRWSLGSLYGMPSNRNFFPL